MVVLTHYLLMIFFICSFCTSFHLPTRNDNSEECSGICVKVTECKSLEQRFGKSMTKEKSDFLKSSWCGFDQGTPKICCPHKQSIEITSDLEEQNKRTTIAPIAETSYSDDDDLEEGFEYSEWAVVDDDNIKGE